MKIKIMCLIGLLVGGSTFAAPTLQIKEFTDSRYRVLSSFPAGNKISVRYNASGWYGQQAVIWLVNAVDGEETILDINKTIVNGYNHLDSRIPFTFWEPGTYYIKLVVNTLDKQGVIKSTFYTTSPAPINILPAVVQPAAGAVLSPGPAWLTWSTEGPIAADFFWVWLINDELGYSEILDMEANPTTRHYRWTVPQVSGSGFKIRLEGFLPIIWDGILVDDEQTEVGFSGEFTIQ